MLALQPLPTTALLYLFIFIYLKGRETGTQERSPYTDSLCRCPQRPGLGPSQSPELAIQSRSPPRVAGTRVCEPSLLSPLARSWDGKLGWDVSPGAERRMQACQTVSGPSPVEPSLGVGHLPFPGQALGSGHRAGLCALPTAAAPELSAASGRRSQSETPSNVTHFTARDMSPGRARSSAGDT